MATLPPAPPRDGKPPYYGHSPADGLHVLKDEWIQKSYIGEQSSRLAEDLPLAISATRSAVHSRTQGFQLGRAITKRMNERSQERRLEAAMLMRWNNSSMWRLPAGWERLVAFQVPLFSQRQQDQWGSIDLLGVDSNGLPIVVELKREPVAHDDGRVKHSETPLRMVLEAAAYAIALQENWTVFRPEWIARLQELDVSQETVSRVPQSLTSVGLVAAAPASFWLNWLPVTARGCKVSREAWLSFKSLLSGLKQHGFPASFVSISGHLSEPDKLGLQPLQDFPLIV